MNYSVWKSTTCAIVGGMAVSCTLLAGGSVMASDQDGGVTAPPPTTERMGQDAKDKRDAMRERAVQNRPRRPKPVARIPAHDPANEKNLGDGLIFIDTKLGSGETLGQGDFATFEYTGWIHKTQVVFGSNRAADKPRLVTDVPGRLIEGWNLGLIGMKEGGRRKLIVPAALGYGERGFGGIGVGPNEDLVFEVELFRILRMPMIETEKATETANGALMMDIKPGEGPAFADNGYGTFHVSWWDDGDNLSGTSLDREKPVAISSDSTSDWSSFAFGLQSGGQRAVSTTAKRKDEEGNELLIERIYLIEAFDITPALVIPDHADSLMFHLEEGLKARDLTIGDGKEFINYSLPEVHMTGWRADGTVFDTTRKPGEDVRTVSSEFDLPLWKYAMKGMKIGGKRFLLVPAALAYGEDGNKELRVAPNEDIMIQVEYLGFSLPLFHPVEAADDPAFMEAWDEEFGEGSGFGTDSDDDDGGLDLGGDGG